MICFRVGIIITHHKDLALEECCGSNIYNELLQAQGIIIQIIGKLLQEEYTI